MKHGDPITVVTKFGVCIGKVHTPGTAAHFAQAVYEQSDGRTGILNVYLKVEDEGKTWVQGHDVDKLKDEKPRS